MTDIVQQIREAAEKIRRDTYAEVVQLLDEALDKLRERYAVPRTGLPPGFTKRPPPHVKVPTFGGPNQEPGVYVVRPIAIGKRKPRKRRAAVKSGRK